MVLDLFWSTRQRFSQHLTWRPGGTCRSQVQVGPGCSDIPYWPGTLQLAIEILDISEQIILKNSGFFMVSSKSSPITQISSDLFRSVLRTLIFCIIVGLLCGLLGAAFNALNIQARHLEGERRRVERCWAGDRSWCGDPSAATHRCLGSSDMGLLWV